jgi:hypothetical protein
MVRRNARTGDVGEGALTRMALTWAPFVLSLGRRPKSKAAQRRWAVHAWQRFDSACCAGYARRERLGGEGTCVCSVSWSGFDRTLFPERADQVAADQHYREGLDCCRMGVAGMPEMFASDSGFNWSMLHTDDRIGRRGGLRQMGGFRPKQRQRNGRDQRHRYATCVPNWNVEPGGERSPGSSFVRKAGASLDFWIGHYVFEKSPSLPEDQEHPSPTLPCKQWREQALRSWPCTKVGLRRGNQHSRAVRVMRYSLR